MNEVLPMKKLLLLLSSALLLAACNSSPADNFAIHDLYPYVEVTYPEAKEITEEQALALTANFAVTYDRYEKDSRIQRNDYTFHYESHDSFKKVDNEYRPDVNHVLECRTRGGIEKYIYEKNDDLWNEIDTLVIHKQTDDYGNVMFISKEDPDLRDHYIEVITEKYFPFYAGSKSVTIRRFADERIAYAYNLVSDYNLFFGFVKNENFTHTVKYYSRGEGSVIMEATSKVVGSYEVNGYEVANVKYKMEFFENLLVGYEYQAYINELVAKKETLSLTYERPEIELPAYWINYLDD